MSDSSNLIRAAAKKDDEFYTQLEDIEDEMQWYHPDTFKDKIIYCNCDSEWSSFVKFFKMHPELGYKDFIYTSDNFASSKNIELLKACDLVVTNPPWSLKTDWLNLVWNLKKKYIVLLALSTMGAQMFPLLRTHKAFCGNDGMFFIRPDGRKMHVPANWYTNCQRKDTRKEIPPLVTGMEYETFDNTDVINIPAMKCLPDNYYGKIAVPITVMKHKWEKEWNILGRWNDNRNRKINGKIIFSRIIIQRKGGPDVYTKTSNSLFG